MSMFYFKVSFLDEDERFLFSDEKSISVEETEYPEGDRDEAGSLLEEWAEEEMESNGADSYEYVLVDAC